MQVTLPEGLRDFGPPVT